ncbi:bacteriocin immunity protein [Pseudomonas salmasensis]|uniref:Bacteriocin immunity protein n=1 Tax=Pseudomonas salmasensis TaxID=2745514 RepID=A0ABU5FFD9_9PSED|nr:bacteriocin immunity protein [Pseudomonas salmasensis]MDY4299037.1 bacteriocin immunity protein [Pseudomonas salmasensis]
MKLKQSFSEYTKDEFLLLMQEILKENTAPTDERLDKLLQHFELITEHPAGTDLIYYAASDAESTIEAITERVENWRATNNKPGFKVEP